jgi:hypothetical protein
MSYQKFFLALTFAFFIALGLPQTVSEAAEIELIIQTPQSVFIPHGFDDDDNVQIIFTGEYPNTCYQMGPTEFHIDSEKKTIRVRDYAYEKESNFCAPLVISYQKVLDLGMLKAAEYSIFFDRDQRGDRLKKRGTLHVAVSQTPGQDNYLYAPVDSINTRPCKENPDYRWITLSGDFRSSCMEFDKVRVERQTLNDETVFVVLPIAKITEDSKCETGRFFFKKEVYLGPFTSEPSLIHVRSLNGGAVNKILHTR